MTATAFLEARTWLFVPGDRPERFTKARDSGADVVIVDLEDAVAPARRAFAREALVASLDLGPFAVRVNPFGSADFDADLVALEAYRGAFTTILAAKAEDPIGLTQLADRLGVPVVALIESAAGIHEAPAIAAAAGVERLAFGAVDYSLDIDARADPDVLAGPRSALVLASRLAELPGPIDTPCVEFRDLSIVDAEARTARRFGMTAKLCIHPAQVSVVDAAFSPTAAEIERAQAILAITEDDGAAAIDGHMIDRPVIERARRIVAAGAR